MEKISEQEFIEFLTTALMSEEKLDMDKALSEEIFDSTGKLLVVTAFSLKFNRQLSVQDLMHIRTPRELYDIL